MELTANKIRSFLQNSRVTIEAHQLKKILENKTPDERKEAINCPLLELQNKTCVHLAAELGLYECLELMLINGGDPDVKSKRNDTPLHVAVSNGKVKCIELLLDYKANPHIESKFKKNPEDSARGKPMCMIAFAHHQMKTQVPTRNRTEENTAKDMHELVVSKEDTEKFKKSYLELHQQCGHKYTDLASRWLDYQNMTLLYRACDKSNNDVVEMILRLSTSKPLPNLETLDTPLLTACKHENMKIVKLLLDHSPQLLLLQDKQLYSAFHYACVNFCDSEMMLFLLEQLILYLHSRQHITFEKFCLDIKNADGYTPLLLACYHGNTDAVKCLIDFYQKYDDILSLDVNTKEDLNGRTALHLALDRGNLTIVSILLSINDLDINVLAKPSNKALNCLVSKATRSSTSKEHSTKCIYSLSSVPNRNVMCKKCGTFGTIKRKIIIGDANDEENIEFGISLTPLAEACMYGDTKIIKLLKDNGASDDDTYQQLCQVMTLSGNLELVQWFLTHNCVDLDENSHVQFKKVKLNWKSRNLTVCEGSWLNSDIVYYCTSPPLSKLDYTCVTEVRLDNNHLNVVPTELFCLPSVECISISHNEILALPGKPWSCNSLKRLNISHNHLKTIPSHVWLLDNLHELDGHSNFLNSLDLPDVGDILSKTLQKVDLSYNQLRDVYEFILKLEGIKEVHLGHNYIKVLPPSLWTSTSLKTVVLSYNNISSLSAIESTTQVSTKCSMSKLLLDHNDFASFPEQLPCLAPLLSHLNISYNNFAHVDIQFIPKFVKTFIAESCNIQWIGNTLDEDTHMSVTQHCFSNKLGACEHRSHQLLENLTTLHLKGNKLTHIQLVWHPPIHKDGKLISKSEFRFDPSVTPQKLLFPSLAYLDLSSNLLEGCFNPNIGHQARLLELSLSNNPGLTDLPLELSLMLEHHSRRLYLSLKLENLPSLVEPPNKYTVDVKQMLSYMKDKLKKSKEYRTMKLFVVGNSGTGKSVLVHRLRREGTSKIASTFGIDITMWNYPNKSDNNKPINFLVWDVSGKESYRVNNQWFYSKQSLYIAVFRLSDGENGVKGLEPWLKNIKVHAHGCPVIIIGTHYDQVNRRQANDLECFARDRYASALYPKIIDVTSISSTRIPTSIFTPMSKLRNKIYDVASHLVLRDVRVGLEYLENEKSLLEQMIPKCFLSLEESIKKKLILCTENYELPVMREDTFRESFGNCFMNDKELDDAVQFLSLRGTILHFNDVRLQDLYFLDCQWLAKVMAYMMEPQGIENGEMTLDSLCSQKDFESLVPKSFLEDYINLLETFGIALKDINHQNLLIPSLLPIKRHYPPVKSTNDKWPLLTRFWPCTEISDGFWPKLICRVVGDQDIDNVFCRLTAKQSQACVLGHGVDETREEVKGNHCVIMLPWRTGIAYVHNKKTLVVIKQEQECSSSDHICKKQIQLHVYVHEWIDMMDELKNDIPGLGMHVSDILHSTTNVLVIMSEHISSLLTVYDDMEIQAYAPCWKCFALANGIIEKKLESTEDHTSLPENKKMSISESRAKSDDINTLKPEVEESESDGLPTETENKTSPESMLVKSSHSDTSHIPMNNTPPNEDKKIFDSSPTPKQENEILKLCISGNQLPCFDIEASISHAIKDVPLCCPEHGEFKVEDIMPDLIFRDMNLFDDQCSTLKVFEDDMLGIGGYGSVCRGELIAPGRTEIVAVKVYQEGREFSHQKELLRSYENIRQEVKILKHTLYCPFLVKLIGVRIQPYLCLLLELAPMGSLKSILEHHRKDGIVLEPLTQKCTALQVSCGLRYLHSQKIAHLDMKSPNILVWKFPYERDMTRSVRIKCAGDVLVKLTDYGTSQSSGKLTIRVQESPGGTLGYNPPEIYERRGQEISSEKVDVFAYGMVLYEILTLRIPFDNITQLDVVGRIIRNGRPDVSERVLVSLKHIMMKCWKRDPNDRPSMYTISKWIESDEIERLRAMINLEMNYCFCACVCRITPEVNTSPKDLHDSKAIDKHEEISRDKADVVTNVQTDEEAVKVKHVESHTQIWTYGRALDDNQGFFRIISYFDGYRGYHLRSYSCEHTDRITTACSVHNYIWIGSMNGHLQIVNALTMSKVYDKKIDRVSNKANKSAILYMQHIHEESVVLITTGDGKIISVLDAINSDGELITEEKFYLPSRNPCYHLVKVVTKQHKPTEVWGTADYSLLVFTRGSKCWILNVLPVQSQQPENRCSLIAHTSFTPRNDKIELSHVWISRRNSTEIVSFDTYSQEQRKIVDCAQFLQDTRKTYVSSLTAAESKVFIGTTSGKVGILDSETATLIGMFCLHKESTQFLLPLPKVSEACVCEELPLSDELEGASTPGVWMARDINPYFRPNPDPDALMMCSIGRGYWEFTDTEQVNTESPLEKSTDTSSTCIQENVVMLTWRSSSTS